MRALALAALLLVAAGCASPEPPRTVTFAVDEPKAAFTLTIEEPGRPPRKIRGDARATPLRPEDRREVLRYFERHIELLADIPAAKRDVDWMKRFRAAYGAERK